MVSLAEAAATPTTKRDKRRRCETNDWINQLPDTERDGALALLADENRYTTDIFALFEENGYPLNYDALGKHRGKRCSCPR